MVTLAHGMNCPALNPCSERECTCGLEWRIRLQTEQTMHAAWRKRAEEAEAANDRLTNERKSLWEELKDAKEQLVAWGLWAAQAEEAMEDGLSWFHGNHTEASCTAHALAVAIASKPGKLPTAAPSPGSTHGT